jgi:energy-coupling factor transporter transmembrane protein EcfT
VKDRAAIFRYKKGSSIYHRLPAPVKFALTLCASIIVMFLPLYAICAGTVFMAVFASVCGFTLREQRADIKPAIYYALFLFALNIAANLYTLCVSADAFADSLDGTFRSGIAAVMVPPLAYIRYAARLLLVMQFSALLFRTTTSIEIKETLCAAETGIRTVMRNFPLARNITMDAKIGKSAALMISFIPALFEIWEKLNRAYQARYGRGGLKKYRILLTALAALSFHHASEKAKALAAREIV